MTRAARRGGSGVRRDPARRPGRRGRRARAPRPAVRLPGARAPRRRGGARRAGAGPVRRAAGRRVPAGAGRRHRPRRSAGVGGQGGVARAGADAPRSRPCAGRWPTGTRGVLADVLRLAVPPRHARVEAEARSRPPGRATRRRGRGGRAPTPAAGAGGARHGGAPGWARYPRGPALLDALAGGRAAHAVWQALPGESWADRLAEAAAATAGRAGARCSSCPTSATSPPCMRRARRGWGSGTSSRSPPSSGPAERYRRWLTVRRGAARVVVGTRSAVFAPLARPGLLAVWDDGDDLHAEPRAPYPHVRDVLLLRAHAAGAALLVGGFARTAEAQVLVESGWAQEVVADRATVRAAAPRVTALNETGEPGRARPGPGRRPAARRRVRGRARRADARAGRCWCRCRGPGTCRGWRARSAARPRAAATAPAR